MHSKTLKRTLNSPHFCHLNLKKMRRSYICLMRSPFPESNTLHFFIIFFLFLLRRMSSVYRHSLSNCTRNWCNNLETYNDSLHRADSKFEIENVNNISC